MQKDAQIFLFVSIALLACLLLLHDDLKPTWDNNPPQNIIFESPTFDECLVGNTSTDEEVINCIEANFTSNTTIAIAKMLYFAYRKEKSSVSESYEHTMNNLIEILNERLKADNTDEKRLL
jgi:hypothetical protein